jgi:Domain of unknown function (DUF4345)
MQPMKPWGTGLQHQIMADAWYVALPNLTVADTRRLEKVGAAVEEFLDKIASLRRMNVSKERWSPEGRREDEKALSIGRGGFPHSSCAELWRRSGSDPPDVHERHGGRHRSDPHFQSTCVPLSRHGRLLLIAAFVRPSWQHVAVIWAVFFAYSLAIGRIISLIVDGIPSPMLLFYLAVELVVGTWGLFVLARERRKAGL